MEIKKIFAIPHYHYDVEWWKTNDLYAKDAEVILDKALEILDKYKNFKFVIDQVLAVRPYWESHPEKREKMLKYLDEGRIEMIGGTFSAPDENIPTGEGLIRQYVYGSRLLEELFGIAPKVAWEIDEFGHPSQMPQIVGKCGLKYYAFARGVNPWNALHPIDFYWEAPDGTRVLAHWLAANYSGMMPIALTKRGRFRHYKKEIEARLKHEGKRATTPYFIQPFGTDFTVPSEEWVEFVRKWNEENDPKIELSTAIDFFNKVEESQISGIPTKSGEYNPVLAGCYESRERVKKGCRISQNSVLECEKWNTIAYIFGKEYPGKEMDKIWENILENDFHDIVCGTGTDRVYRNTLKRYEEAQALIEKNKNEALNFLTNKIDTTGDGQPYIVFNALNWEREDIVELNLENEGSFKIVDGEGLEIPSQRVGKKLIFIARVPSMGYKVFFLQTNSSESDAVSPPLEMTKKIENEFYELEIDERTGCLKRIWDKKENQEIIETLKYQGNEIIIEEEVGNLWTIHKTGKITRVPSEPPNIALVENGPIRWVWEVKKKYKDLESLQRIILYSRIERIDFKTEIDFKTKAKRIKVVFPPFVRGKRYYETPFYVETEREDGHWPVENWVDISNEESGLAVINRGNPGYDVMDGTVGIVLFRSVASFSWAYFKFFFKNLGKIIKLFWEASKLARKGLNNYEWAIYDVHGIMLREYATEGGKNRPGGINIFDHLAPMLRWFRPSLAWERGKHNFNYAILPHEGDYKKVNLPRKGWEFNNPLTVIKADLHQGELTKEYSFCEIPQANIILGVLKKSEKNGEIVARCYETFGEDKGFNFNFFKTISKARRTSATEEEIYSDEIVEDKEIKGKISHWEIATFKFGVK